MTETRYPETIMVSPLIQAYGAGLVKLETPESDFTEGTWSIGEHQNIDAAEYRRADLQPKVKALGEDITVKTLFGSYFIEDQDYEYVLFFIPPTAKKRSDWQMLGVGGYGEMVNERQDHYESLVFDCLETTQ